MKELTRAEAIEEIKQKILKKHAKAFARNNRRREMGVINTIDEYQEYKRRLHPEYYLEPTYENIMRVYDRVKNMSKTEWFIFKARTDFNHVMNRINLWLEMRGI